MDLPDIRDLLPHSGPMVLLDRVVSPPMTRVCAPKCGCARIVYFASTATLAAGSGSSIWRKRSAPTPGIARACAVNRCKIGYLLGTRHYECKPAMLHLGQLLENLCQAGVAKRRRLGRPSIAVSMTRMARSPAPISTVFQPADGAQPDARHRRHE